MTTRTSRLAEVRRRWTGRVRMLAPTTVLAAGWAAHALRRARAQLNSEGLQARVALPPRLPAKAVHGVRAVLRRTRPTCLEGAAVLQAWLAGQGEAVDLVIGVVDQRDRSFVAHAWVDLGVVPPDAAGYREIHRLRRSDVGQAVALRHYPALVWRRDQASSSPK